MGILDDAIREHLDLKRRLGAAQDEIARLEDEAFGPPTRPGDPDFPEPEEGEDATGEFETGEEPEPSATREPPQDTAPFDASAEAAAFEPAPAGTDVAPAGDELGNEAGLSTAEAAGDPTEAAEPPAPAADAAVEEASDSDLDLELDLDLEEEAGEVVEEEAEEADEDLLAEAPGTEEEPLLGEVEPAPEPDVPIESLDTVEHHFEGAIDEAEVVEEDEPLPAETETSEEGRSEGEGEGEDVLEETPEFLRDNPDDDELWFEQGEPKDFDF